MKNQNNLELDQTFTKEISLPTHKTSLIGMIIVISTLPVGWIVNEAGAISVLSLILIGVLFGIGATLFVLTIILSSINKIKEIKQYLRDEN